jgi:hypothetical protein
MAYVSLISLTRKNRILGPVVYCHAPSSFFLPFSGAQIELSVFPDLLIAQSIVALHDSNKICDLYLIFSMEADVI